MSKIGKLRQRLAGRWDKKEQTPFEHRKEQADKDTTKMHKKWAEGEYSHIEQGNEIKPWRDTGDYLDDEYGVRGPRKTPPSRLTNLKRKSEFSENPHFTEPMTSEKFRPGVVTRKYPKKMTEGFSREYIEKEKLAKLKQRIAQVRLAYASPPKDVIKAFRNKEALKMHAKKKGGGELSFQTDGKTLYQLSPDPPQRRYEIATWVDDGLEWSYENHPTPSTSQAGRMLGINTFTKDGKTFVDGKEVNPYSYDRTFIPNEHLQEGTVKVNPRAHVKKYKDYTPEEKQKIKDQDVFRQKANKQWKETKHLGGHIITDPDTGEIYDQAKIQPHEQKEINRILGYEKELPRGSFVKDFHHANPVSKKSGPTGGIFDRVSPSGSVPLGKRGHAEAHDPAGTIPPSFRKRILKARLKIARIRQRNISRRVTQINMAKEDYEPVQAWATMIRNLKGKPAHQLAGNWTYIDGDLVDFDRPGSKETLMKSVKGNPKLHIFTVSNTHGIKHLFDDNGVVNPELQKRYDQLSSLNIGKTTIGKWEDNYDATVNFRDIDNKKAEEIARGAKGDIPQQAYIETFLNQETGKPESKFHSYNKKTDTYE